MDDKIVMYDSSEAAQFRTGLSGWVSRQGFFWGDSEHAARYQGCTHQACKECGFPSKKGWLLCDSCREKKDIERYEKLEKAEWDETGMVYSEMADKYFSDWDEINDYCDEHGCALVGLRLVICDPVYLRQIETDCWSGDMPDGWEDDDLPSDVLSALNELNFAIESAGHVSWMPGKRAVLLK